MLLSWGGLDCTAVTGDQYGGLSGSTVGMKKGLCRKFCSGCHEGVPGVIVTSATPVS
jgi:hypothetical protein